MNYMTFVEAIRWLMEDRNVRSLIVKDSSTEDPRILMDSDGVLYWDNYSTDPVSIEEVLDKHFIRDRR